MDLSLKKYEVKKMEEIYVGIDVSKDTFEVSIKDWRKNLLVKPRSYVQTRDGMEKFLEHVETTRSTMGAQTLIGMEATGIYHLPLYNALARRGYRVRIFNALELVKYHKFRIRKTKTDKIDSGVIADALIHEGYKPPKEDTSENITTLREYCRVRERLVYKLSVCKVQATRDLDTILRGYDKLFDDTFCKTSRLILKKYLRQKRIKIPVEREVTDLLNKYMSKSRAEEKARKIVLAFQNALRVDHLIAPTVRELYLLMAQMELLEKQIKLTENKIQKVFSTTKSKITTIPGIGTVTGAIILSEIGNIRNFERAEQLVAYAGLDPVVKESGKYKASSSNIYKRGSPALREALYLAAFGSLKHYPVCKLVYERMRSKDKHFKVALCAVARKLLHIIYSVLKNDRDFYVPNYISSTTTSS